MQGFSSQQPHRTWTKVRDPIDARKDVSHVKTFVLLGLAKPVLPRDPVLCSQVLIARYPAEGRSKIPDQKTAKRDREVVACRPVQGYLAAPRERQRKRAPSN